MKVELSVEKRGPNVEFRAAVVASDLTEIVRHPCVDVIALPAVFIASPIEQHVRPKSLLAIPLEDALRLARQILGMKE